MLNSTKTWQERFKEEFSFRPHLLRLAIPEDFKLVLNEINDKRDEEIVKFISDLRKQDEDELIKMLEENISSDGFFSLNQVKFILQDYYAK